MTGNDDLGYFDAFMDAKRTTDVIGFQNSVQDAVILGEERARKKAADFAARITVARSEVDAWPPLRELLEAYIKELGS